MPKLTYINPLKPGKLEEYKSFCAENMGPRKKEYLDLLYRYGLKTVAIYTQTLAGREFAIVVHDAEKDALERLASFSSSKNPYDIWFLEQLNSLHDFSEIANPQAKLLLEIY